MNVEDVIVIGAGPAGLATALQLKRSGISARVFEAQKTGGLLNNANLVENYPGFPGGIPGPQLVDLFEEHIRSLCIEITPEKVEELDWQRGVFRVATQHEAYHARIAVVATGTKPRPYTKAHFAGSNGRFFYEIYPLLHIMGKRVAIVGAGDAAFDYALNLAKHNQVAILNRSDEVTCLPLLWERAAATRSIVYHANTCLDNISYDQPTGVILNCSCPGGFIRLEVDYMVAAIGRVPCLDFITPSLNEISGRLENQGLLYVVGDVKNKLYRQTAIAVGDGILAAMKIHQRFKEKVS